MPMTTTQAAETAGASRGVYPHPLNAKDATLDSCPLDYYSTSGSCCPSAYTPWTGLLGGRTPCISTATASTTPPPIVGSTSPASIIKPTEVVTGVVFAMQYAVREPQGTLTPAAIAGIAVGGIACIAGTLGLALLIRKCRRNARKTSVLKDELYGNFYEADAMRARSTSSTPPPRYREPSSEFGQAELYSLKPSKEAPLDAPVDLYIPDSPICHHKSLKSIGWKQMSRTLGRSQSQDSLFEPRRSTLAEGLPSKSQVQLARQQRLSRAYPRIVYTHGPGSNSSVSEGVETRPGTAGSSMPSIGSPTRQVSNHPPVELAA
ncbi:hypothetical protein MFIFM68171_09255 [Madurella fahalii]|uniref:Uncharacterized protein n=1 Tax=Madurella fahalii TaxID=1157608 RepID=A0ABQ0GMU2_9PEZI